MKKNRILIISIVLAIAFVACPIESTRNITAGIGFILGAVSVAWLGVRQRKGAQKEYEDTVRRYTGTTMMKVVWIEESVNERWEQQEDGSEQLRRETVYLPTYEYTVNGKTYRYASRQTVSGKRELDGRWSDITIPLGPTVLPKTSRESLFWVGCASLCLPRSCSGSVSCPLPVCFPFPDTAYPCRVAAGAFQPPKTCVRSACCKKTGYLLPYFCFIFPCKHFFRR